MNKNPSVPSERGDKERLVKEVNKDNDEQGRHTPRTPTERSEVEQGQDPTTSESESDSPAESEAEGREEIDFDSQNEEVQLDTISEGGESSEEERNLEAGLSDLALTVDEQLELNDHHTATLRDLRRISESAPNHSGSRSRSRHRSGLRDFGEFREELNRLAERLAARRAVLEAGREVLRLEEGDRKDQAE